MPIQPKQQPPYYNTNQLTAYQATIKQNGSDPFEVDIIINTLNVSNWQEFDIGAYFAETTTPNADLNKFRINNQTIGGGIQIALPVTDYGGIIGYIVVNATPGTTYGKTNVCITIDSFDETGTYVNLSTLITTGKFTLPLIIKN